MFTQLRTVFLFCTLAIFYSCDQVERNININVLTKEDSSKLSVIEYYTSYSDFDSALLVIDSLISIEEYKNHKAYLLKLFDNKARIYLKLKRFQDALDVINQIIEETENERELYNNNFVGANLLKGDIYYELGNYRTAYKYYYIGKESSTSQSQFCSYAMYDYRISLILYRQEKYLESSNSFKNSFVKYNDCNKKDFFVKFRQQEILSNIGLCFYKLEKYDSSLYYFNSALKFLNNIIPENKSHKIYKEVAEGVVDGNIGKVYIAQKKYNNAVPLLKKNIEINSKIKYDNLDALTSVIALANYYMSVNDFEKFNYLIDLPKKYYSYPNYREQILFIYELKSKYYEKIGDYKSSLLNFKKYEFIKDSLTKIKQKNVDSDIQLSIESLERENQFNKLSKENQQRKFYIYIAIYISVGLIILIITISIFLNLSNKKNIALKKSNEEVIKQQNLLKKANEEILHNIEILKQKDIEKNKILSIVAHDLRNPNNVIISIIDSLKNETPLNKEQLEYLNLIDLSAKSNKDLIQEILYFANTEKISTTDDYQVVSCSELVKQIVSLNLYRASQKHIELILDTINPNLMININTDKIRRAFSNIIVNAIKFSHHYKTIHIYTSNTEDQITFHIKDNGIGIPDRIKDNIFISDPNTRRLGTDGEASFGLGLSIVKQIIEEHQGKISFTSNISGTTFSLTLPLYKSTAS